MHLGRRRSERLLLDVGDQRRTCLLFKFPLLILSHPVAVITRTFAIVTDAIVLIVTWMKTADTWRLSRDIRNFHPSLSTLLLRDGLWCLSSIHVLADVCL